MWTSGVTSGGDQRTGLGGTPAAVGLLQYCRIILGNNYNGTCNSNEFLVLLCNLNFSIRSVPDEGIIRALGLY
jgi:hypothetical protein